MGFQERLVDRDGEREKRDGEREKGNGIVCYCVSLFLSLNSDPVVCVWMYVCMYFDGMGPCVEVGVGPT